MYQRYPQNAYLRDIGPIFPQYLLFFDVGLERHQKHLMWMLAPPKICLKFGMGRTLMYMYHLCHTYLYRQPHTENFINFGYFQCHRLWFRNLIRSKAYFFHWQTSCLDPSHPHTPNKYKEIIAHQTTKQNFNPNLQV